MALRILLADGSVALQRMGAKILSAADHEVVTVSNGLAAIRKISEFDPHVLLLDVHLAGRNGIEICEKVKRAPETSHIVALLTVGNMEPLPASELENARADGFVTKPFEAIELVATMGKLAEKIQPIPAKETWHSAIPKVAIQSSSEQKWAEMRARIRDSVAEQAIPSSSAGGEVCDVCGHVNREDASVCESCDVPLPSSLKSRRCS